MSLEVGHRDEGIGILDDRSHLHGLAVPKVHWNLHIVGPLQSVRDNNGGVDHWVDEAVPCCKLEVVHGVGAHALVEGAAVGQERPPSPLGHHVHHLGHQFRPEVGGVPLLPEVGLDCDKVPGVEGLSQPGLPEKLLDLGENALAGPIGPQISEVDL